MADRFTPRGAPVPQNPYDGWDLTHSPAMLPFLAEYTNAQGHKAGGWAMPTMVEMRLRTAKYRPRMRSGITSEQIE